VSASAGVRRSEAPARLLARMRDALRRYGVRSARTRSAGAVRYGADAAARCGALCAGVRERLSARSDVAGARAARR